MSKKNDFKLLYGIFAGAVGGFLGGWLLPEYMVYVGWMGEIFLNALKMVIVPLVMFSMISGVASIGNINKLGRFGGTTILYYLATTSVAVAIGLFAVNLIEPGEGISGLVREVPEHIKSKEEFSFIDVLTGMVSRNIVESMANMDILPIIIFSLLLGGILSSMEERAKSVISFFDTLNEAILKMVHLIMYMAPLGIFGLIGGKIGSIGPENIQAELLSLGKYFITVVGALAVHGLVVLPLLYFLFTRKNPFEYLKNTLPAVLTAFSTASSSATLPVTIECAEQNNKVSKKTAGFVLPIGATVNMDGTALYEAVAAMFIAQSYGIELSFSAQLVIFLTASLAAIGAAGIPEAGLVTMVLVLKAVGLPIEGIAMLLAIDWLLDRFRTSVNVMGDAIGAGILDNVFYKKQV